MEGQRQDALTLDVIITSSSRPASLGTTSLPCREVYIEEEQTDLVDCEYLQLMILILSTVPAR